MEKKMEATTFWGSIGVMQGVRVLDLGRAYLWIFW